MKEIVILFIITFAASCKSKPLSTGQEVMAQLLSVREDILSAKQFTRMMEASKVSEMPTDPSWLLHLSQQHLRLIHDGDKASQQRQLNNEVILQKVRNLIMGRGRSSALVTHREPGRIAQAQLARDELKPSTSRMRDFYSRQDQLGHVDVARDPKWTYTTGRAKATFIFEVPFEEMEKLGAIFKGHVFECVTNITREIANSIELSKGFNNSGDIPVIKNFQKLADIFKGANFNSDTLVNFITFILDFFHLKDNRVSSIAKNQAIERALVKVLKMFSEVYNNNSNNSVLGSILRIIPVLLSNSNDKMTLNNAANIFINHSLKTLDGIQFLNEDTRDALKEVSRIVIPAYLKQLNGGELSTDDRKRLVRSYVKLFVSFNSGTNHSLLHLADRLLSDYDKQTGGDIDSNSKCLFGLILRNLLEPLLRRLAGLDKNFH